MDDIPEDIIRGLDAGELTEAQLRELIRIEAVDLGFTLEEAIQKASTGDLPRTHIGSDVEFLVEMLSA